MCRVGDRLKRPFDIVSVGRSLRRHLTAEHDLLGLLDREPRPLDPVGEIRLEERLQSRWIRRRRTLGELLTRELASQDLEQMQSLGVIGHACAACLGGACMQRGLACTEQRADQRFQERGSWARKISGRFCVLGAANGPNVANK